MRWTAILRRAASVALFGVIGFVVLPYEKSHGVLAGLCSTFTAALLFMAAVALWCGGKLPDWLGGEPDNPPQQPRVVPDDRLSSQIPPSFTAEHERALAVPSESGPTAGAAQPTLPDSGDSHDVQPSVPSAAEGSAGSAMEARPGKLPLLTKAPLSLLERIGLSVILISIGAAVAWAVLKSSATDRRASTTASSAEAGDSAPAEAVYAKASPGVVTITAKNEDGDPISIGSGFFLQENSVNDLEGRRLFDEDKPPRLAHVATNYHVIEAALDADVTLHDGSTGLLLGVYREDEAADLAVLAVQVYSPVAALPMADGSPHVGQPVYAIGSPHGLANSLSSGMVSGVREGDPAGRWLQTTAPISPGSSGGPLLSRDSEVIGVNTSAHKDAQNLNFAVPVSELHALLAGPGKRRSLEDGRSVTFEEDKAFSQFEPVAPNAEHPLWKAHLLLKDGKYNDVITLLEAARRTVPPEFSYLHYYALGKAHAELAIRGLDFSKPVDEMQAKFRNSYHGMTAVQSLTQAATLNPAFAPTYDVHYEHCKHAATWDSAYRAADSLVRLLPHCARAHYVRGCGLNRLGESELAQAELRESLRLNPRQPDCHAEIADALEGLQEYDKAIDSYNAALAVAEEMAKKSELYRRLQVGQIRCCQFNVGNAYQKVGKYEQAMRAFEKAKALGMMAEECDRRIAECRRRMR